MKQLKKIISWVIDFFEVYLPIAVFITLFIVFLVNVIFRYVLKNPQNWTFEFSVISFVVVGLLGACTAYRNEDHVVFDLLYNRINNKIKNIFRIISYVMIIIAFSLAIPHSIRYLIKLRAVTSIMRIPLYYIFSSFPIMLILILYRSVYRIFMDIKALKNKTYVQEYNIQKEETLI